MKKIIFFVFLYTPLAAFCQNLTGTWEGSGGGVTYIRMVIRHVGDSVFGYTYDEGGGFCKATFAARYTRSKKRLAGRGMTMLQNSGTHVLADYDLIYSREPRGEFLRDNVGEEGLLEKLFGNSRMYLKKTSTTVDLPKRPAPARTPQPEISPVKKEVPKKAPVTTPPVVKKEVKKTVVVPPKPVAKTVPAKPPPLKKTETILVDTVSKASIKKIQKITAPATLLKEKDERSSKLVQTIYTGEDTVKMMVYDNGEVDGDTVTVFFDNAIILNRYRISEKAKEISLPVRRGEQHIIELFANNLGSIPPNTALIIIMAGNKRYELRASYDFKTNARIIIQHKE